MSNSGGDFQCTGSYKYHLGTTSASSQQSATMLATTTVVWLFAEQDTWVAVGTDPTAAAVTTGNVSLTSFKLRGGFYRAERIQYVGQKFAFLQVATAGEFEIIEGL